MRIHEIKIESVSEADYKRLVSAAASHEPPLSIRNYVRLLLGIPLKKRGNPTGNKGKRVKQPKRS